MEKEELIKKIEETKELLSSLEGQLYECTYENYVDSYIYVNTCGYMHVKEQMISNDEKFGLTVSLLGECFGGDENNFFYDKKGEWTLPCFIIEKNERKPSEKYTNIDTIQISKISKDTFCNQFDILKKIIYG